MTDFLKATILANEEINLALKDGLDSFLFDKTDIGAGGDVSSRLDLFAESVFVKYLSKFGQIESEESGVIGDGSIKIIIDPIDGSSNALSLFPYFGTSVASIGEDGVLSEAIVCNQANGDIFFKSQSTELKYGKLFSDNYSTPQVSPNPEIGLFEKSYANFELVNLLNEEGLKFRSPGAIALSLAYAHTVKFVLFVGAFRIYDFVAGLALCEGLEVIVEADYVIVSKDIEIANKIEVMIKKLNQGL